MSDVTEKLLNQLSEFLDETRGSSQTQTLTAGQAFRREVDNDPGAKAAVENCSKGFVERAQVILAGQQQQVRQLLHPHADEFIHRISRLVSNTVRNFDDKEQPTAYESKAAHKTDRKADKRGGRPRTKRAKLRNQRLKFCVPLHNKGQTWSQICHAYYKKFPSDEKASPDTLRLTFARNSDDI